MDNVEKEIEMASTDKALTSGEAWESGRLGQDEEHARRTEEGADKSLDNALNLQLISIRLPKTLINDLKIIAKLEGIGYQPLIRQLLSRFVIAEKKRVLLDALEATRSQEKALAREDRAIAKEEKRQRDKKAA
ncbi:MAG: hypothetical protein ACT4P9_11400 [Betaproteobacteria bacterium]